jgi:hypothetical protein
VQQRVNDNRAVGEESSEATQHEVEVKRPSNSRAGAELRQRHLREEFAVWDAQTRRRIGRWHAEDPQDAVVRAVFAFDGESVLVQLGDPRQRQLPMDPLAAAIRIAPRELTASERAIYGIGGRAPALPTDRPIAARVLLEHTLAARNARDLPRAEALLKRAQTTRLRMPPRYLFMLSAVLALRAELQGPLSDDDRNRVSAAMTEWVRSGDGSARLATTLPELAALQQEGWFREAVQAAAAR